MFSRPAVAVFALVVAELFVLTRASSSFGLGIVLLALLGLSMLGLAVLRRGGAGLIQASVAKVAAGEQDAVDSIADRVMVVLAGLLLFVPGLVTGVIGAALLIPPIRAALRPMLAHRVQPLIPTTLTFGRGQTFRRDVVDVDVVDTDVVDTDVVDTDGPSSSYHQRPSELN